MHEAVVVLYKGYYSQLIFIFLDFLEVLPFRLSSLGLVSALRELCKNLTLFIVFHCSLLGKELFGLLRFIQVVCFWRLSRIRWNTGPTKCKIKKLLIKQLLHMRKDYFHNWRILHV